MSGRGVLVRALAGRAAGWLGRRLGHGRSEERLRREVAAYGEELERRMTGLLAKRGDPVVVALAGTAVICSDALSANTIVCSRDVYGRLRNVVPERLVPAPETHAALDASRRAPS